MTLSTRAKGGKNPPFFMSRQDSNLQPQAYKASALSVELRNHMYLIIKHFEVIRELKHYLI